MSRAISTILKGDRRKIVYTLGEEVEQLLGADLPIPQEVWKRIKGWYKAAVDRVPPPARATLERIMAERVNIYS